MQPKVNFAFLYKSNSFIFRHLVPLIFSCVQDRCYQLCSFFVINYVLHWQRRLVYPISMYHWRLNLNDFHWPIFSVFSRLCILLHGKFSVSLEIGKWCMSFVTVGQCQQHCKKCYGSLFAQIELCGKFLEQNIWITFQSFLDNNWKVNIFWIFLWVRNEELTCGL